MIWREKLDATEKAFGIALAHTRKIQSEYDSMSPADGNFALEEALRLQNDAMGNYARVLKTFTRLILYGEVPEESLEPEPAKPKHATDLEIQAWVFKHHDFVPPLAWIVHCRELYLNAPKAARTQDCPPTNRGAIREAFVALEILSE